MAEKTSGIHLGFEVGTGKPVDIPLDHLIITGRTRQSGKTTTLEAIAVRSGLRTLSFVTKPGEDTFTAARVIQPYFHDQGGWRFVASVLEATLGEKLKRERAEIINASNGARSLREVYDRIVAKKAKTRSGWVADVLTALEAYLEIVLPQIERTSFAPALAIGSGANVIDLSGPDHTDELRALVIRSALEWVSKHEQGVLTVIPEAWQFIPEGRGNPVKAGCERLIRMGGVRNNWVGIDSQEVTAVDAGIRKSCGIWILGVQRELNEVKRVIDQLPGRPKPTPDEVMELGLGQFFVSYTGAQTRKVYVQPVWMDEAAARAVATGKLELPRAPAAAKHVPPETQQKKKGRDELPNEEMRELNRKVDLLLDRMSGQPPEPPWTEAASTAAPPSSSAHVTDEEALFQRFRARLLKDPVVLKVLTTRPELIVEVKTATITVDGRTLPGRVAELVGRQFFDTPKRHVDVKKQLERTGTAVNGGDLTRQLKALVVKGFLTDEAHGYQSVPGMKASVVSA